MFQREDEIINKRMKVQLNISDENIVEGVCGDSANCAVNLALREVFNLNHIIDVSLSAIYIFIYDESSLVFKILDIKPALASFLKEFDSLIDIEYASDRLQEVSARSFIIDINEDEIKRLEEYDKTFNFKEAVKNSESLKFF